MDFKHQRKYFLKKTPVRSNRSHQPTTINQRQSCLTPLQRLERFKKLQNFPSQKIKKRVQFAMDMEPGILNGTNEPDVSNKEEKILRPRKPQHEELIENGTKNESLDEVNGHSVNGFDEEVKEQLVKEKKDLSKKQSAKKSIIEVTATPESPPKRELRRRESTPKTEPHNRRGTPSKVNVAESEYQSISEKHTLEEVDDTNGELKKSVVIEDSVSESNEKKSHKDDDVITEFQEELSVSCRSTFSSISTDIVEKDQCEASSSSPSIICLDSPVEMKYDLTNEDFKGRKPINSFSKFPGRTISITSLNTSIKRKSDESLDDEESRKKFAGHIESNQNKPSAWKFFSSPFGKAWSPSSQSSKSNLTSTPFAKRNLEDSMTVNYDENTKHSLDDSTILEEDDKAQPKKLPSRNRCLIM